LTTSGSVRLNSAKFVGAYAVFDKGGFYSDIGYRHSTYDANATNAAAGLNVTNGQLGGTSDNLNASIGYRVRTSNYFIEPSAGLSWTRSNFDNLAATDPSGLPYMLAFNTFNSLLGRVGVGGGPTFVVQNRYVVEPFVSASVWREFANSADGVFSTGASTALLSTDRIGSFYQLGVGVSARLLNTGALGFVRSDFRFGDRFDSWAVLGGFRWTFDATPEHASNKAPKTVGTIF
jgi:outer membrane autotransporter protein